MVVHGFVSKINYIVLILEFNTKQIKKYSKYVFMSHSAIGTPLNSSKLRPASFPFLLLPQLFIFKRICEKAGERTRTAAVSIIELSGCLAVPAHT